MKSTTKIKQILLLFDVNISLKLDETYNLVLIDKHDQSKSVFSDPCLPNAWNQAHSYFKKWVKERGEHVPKMPRIKKAESDSLYIYPSLDKA